LRPSWTRNTVHQCQKQRIAISKIGRASAAGVGQRDRILPVSIGSAGVKMNWSAGNSPDLVVRAIVLALNDKLFRDSQQRQK
jgi:hypothetical protein